LHWVDEKSVLFLGLDSGAIHRFKLTKEKNLRIMTLCHKAVYLNFDRRIKKLSQKLFEKKFRKKVNKYYLATTLRIK
jgi:hypothetical protein